MVIAVGDYVTGKRRLKLQLYESHRKIIDAIERALAELAAA